MIRPKTILGHPIRTLLNHRNLSQFHPLTPKQLTETQINTKSSLPNPIFHSNFSLSTLVHHEFATQEANENSKQPLEAFFTEAVGLSKTNIEEGEEDEKEKLKKSLKKLEVELSRYKKDSTNETKTSSVMFSKPLETLFTEAVGLSEKGEENKIKQIENDDKESKKGLKTLSNMFMSNDQRVKARKESRKVEEPMEFKELSPDMAMFAKYLHKKGYLKNANFLLNNKFDASCFENNYGRDFLKFAAENFAQDNRQIYKWLPDSDLKKVAQFGCPSIGRKNVFAAKSMRFFYGIEEESVCKKCVLKESCKFANQSVWKKGAKNMDLSTVMRVITLYALEAVPTQMEVSDEVKNAVHRLLKEVIRLSELES